MDTLAQALAKRIVAMRFDDMPSEAIYWSKIAVMDTLGVMLAGAEENCVRIVRSIAGTSDGPCHVAGSTGRTDCLNAALINGTAAHAIDFDNGSNSMGGHISATVVPALLAAAEAYGGSGRDFLLAHTVGFETGARIGHGVNFHHYEKGWHPTSTLGAFAVIAACSNMLKLTTEQTATALAIGASVASVASGIKANFGTMTKPLHAGHCARNGLLAVLLAREGFTANTGAFEHQQGFFNVYNGAGTHDARRILDHWADPLEIIRPGAGYKEYPCCAATHAVLDATFALIRDHGPITAEHIAQIETWTPARRLAHTNRPDPQSSLDAKFSIQYCVARALLDGHIIIGQFEGDAYRDPATRKLMQRLRAEVHRPGQFTADNHFGAEITISLTDGQRLSSRVDIQRGRTTDNPIPPGLLRTKYRRADVLLTHAQRMLPGLGSGESARWMGCRPSLPDALPIIDRSPKFPRVFLAFGHAHYGLTEAPATGRLIAELIGNKPPFINPGPYRANRF